MATVNQVGDALEFPIEDLWIDKKFFMDVVKQYGDALEFAS